MLLTPDSRLAQTHSWHHYFREAFGDFGAMAAILIILFATPRFRNPITWWVMLVLMLITFFFMGTQTDRTLTAGIAAIPVGNVIVMMQDAITGVFLWPYILEAVVVNLILVVFCLRIARSILRVESLLIGSGDGGFWRFAQGSKIIGRVLGRSQRYG